MRRVLSAVTLLFASVFLVAAAPTAISGRVVTHSYPLRSPGGVPPCTAADSCVVDCYATASSWECKKPDGTLVPVTQGVGTTYTLTPWGYAATITSEAMAPKILQADAETLLPGGSSAFWSGNWTILGVNNANAFSTGTSGIFNHYDGTDGVWLYTNGVSQQNCTRVGPSGSATGVVSSTSPRWQVAICSSTSGGSVNLHAAGTDATQQTQAGALGAIADAMMFGRYGTALGAGFSLRGQLARVRIYSRVTTAAEKATLERQLLGGVTGEGREITTSRTSTAWMEHGDGFVYAYAANIPRIDPRYGLLIEGTRTNYLLNSSNASLFPNPLGTPTVTPNVESGPLSTALGAAEVDMITDDSAAASEGWHFTTAVQNGGWAASCYLKAGTQDKVQMFVAPSGGTGTATCTHTLTSSWARYSCTMTAGASTGAQNFAFQIGDAVTDTGTIYISHCQLEFHTGQASVTSPIPTGGTAVQRANENITGSTTGWPAVELLFCANLYWPTDQRDRSASYLGNMLIDSTGAGSAPPGQQFWSWYEGTLGAYNMSANVAYTPAFPFTGRFCTRRTYSSKYNSVKGVWGAPAAAGSLLPGHNSTFRLGTYGGTTLPLNGYINDFTVTR